MVLLTISSYKVTFLKAHNSTRIVENVVFHPFSTINNSARPYSGSKKASFPVHYFKCVKAATPCPSTHHAATLSLSTCTCKNSKTAMFHKPSRGCKRRIIVSCCFHGSHSEMDGLSVVLITTHYHSSRILKKRCTGSVGKLF